MTQKKNLENDVYLTCEDIKAARRQAGTCVSNRMVLLSMRKRQQRQKRQVESVGVYVVF